MPIKKQQPGPAYSLGRAAEEKEKLFRPEAVYFDTNPLIAAGWPTPSAQLLQVMDEAERLHLTLCLPDVVCQELQGHWIRELRQEWEGANSKIENLNRKARSTLKFGKLPSLPADDVLLTSLSPLLNEFIRRFRIAPITKRSLSYFIGLAITRGATFKDEGKGFQDSVILCTVLDDMIAYKLATAVIVTHDDAFNGEGAAKLARSAGVTLKVVPTLDDLQELLRKHFNSIVRKVLESERDKLILAVTNRQAELKDFLVANLNVTPSQLDVAGRINGIESLDLLEIVDAHATFGIAANPQTTVEGKVSVDVKIRLHLDIEPNTPPEPPVRLKVGGRVLPEPMDSVAASIAAFALSINPDAARCDAIAVVEADAKRTGDQYSEIKFTNARLKLKDNYLDFVRSLWPIQQ